MTQAFSSLFQAFFFHEKMYAYIIKHDNLTFVAIDEITKNKCITNIIYNTVGAHFDGQIEFRKSKPNNLQYYLNIGVPFFVLTESLPSDETKLTLFEITSQKCKSILCITFEKHPVLCDTTFSNDTIQTLTTKIQLILKLSEKKNAHNNKKVMYSLLDFLSKPEVLLIFDKLTFLKETLRHKLCEFYYVFEWAEVKDYYRKIFTHQELPPLDAVDKTAWGDWSP